MPARQVAGTLPTGRIPPRQGAIQTFAGITFSKGRNILFRIVAVPLHRVGALSSESPLDA